MSILLTVSDGLIVTLNGELIGRSAIFLQAGLDILEISSDDGSEVSWYFIEPVRAEYDNLAGGRGPGIDSIAYSVEKLPCASSLVIEAGASYGFPGLGTFYVAIELPTEISSDTVWSVEPLHHLFPDIVQVSVRPDDTYLGYLMELINTPFIMAPRGTPGGFHQADDRLGSDCAGFAVYGRRRQGYDVRYLGPRGIIVYLEPLMEGVYVPFEDNGIHVYRSLSGNSLPVGKNGLRPGDIVHFGDQVSIFYMDAGAPGILDSEDLLLQSWFDGPHFCTVRDNGFFGLACRAFKWAE